MYTIFHVVHHNIIQYICSRELQLDEYETIMNRHCNSSRILINTLSVYGGCYGQLAAYEGFMNILVKCLILLYQSNK
jgi:hypothetical protein